MSDETRDQAAAGGAGEGQGAHVHHDDHRNLNSGMARAAVFGVSDGLVSNASLVLGIAGADDAQGFVRLAGVAGLIAGAVSMAAGEYVSMRAQRELVERELEVERREHRRNPHHEIAELAKTYEQRGVDADVAREMAEGLMEDPEQALEVHAREEMGIDPNELGSPWLAAVSSFLAFCVGALLPLFPWFFGGGGGAVVASIVLAVIGAAGVGAALARFTGRSVFWSSGRQVLIASGAAVVTYAIGTAVGTGV
ncbi:MAG: VIT1/CCC1 transporter family protein [Acidimicrobiales bacterium]